MFFVVILGDDVGRVCFWVGVYFVCFLFVCFSGGIFMNVYICTHSSCQINFFIILSKCNSFFLLLICFFFCCSAFRERKTDHDKFIAIMNEWFSSLMRIIKKTVCNWIIIYIVYEIYTELNFFNPDANKSRNLDIQI